MHVLAIDCDLRRLHAVSTVAGRVCYNAPDLEQIRAFLRTDRPEVVLFEMAGMVYGNKMKNAAIVNYMRWAIYNSVQAGVLNDICLHELGHGAVFATSAIWTRGYNEKTRHIMAKCAGADNHDIRECRAMLYFHHCEPQRWVPLTHIMENI